MAVVLVLCVLTNDVLILKSQSVQPPSNFCIELCDGADFLMISAIAK